MTAPLQPEQKPVAQIRAEWQEIEAYRPGGGLEAALSAITPETKAKATERELHLLSIIETLNDTVKSYHTELGIVLAALATQQAELTRLRSALAEAEASKGKLIEDVLSDLEFSAAQARKRLYAAKAKQEAPNV